MAKTINVDALSLNPEEVRKFSEIIMEKVFNKPELSSLHNVVTGVKMKEQIVLATQLGLTGLKSDGASARKTSGATTVLSQKYWMPQGIEETLIHDQVLLNGLFKAYYGKIKSYKETYEIEASDEEVFLTMLITEAVSKTIYRAIWFADEDVDESSAGTAAGLIDVADIPYFDYIDGIWKQVFEGVTATSIERYTIAENAETTKTAQLTLATDRAEAILEAVYEKADPRLKADDNAKFYVSGVIFENFRKTLQKRGADVNVINTMEGFRTIMFNGFEIVNMETIWDTTLKTYFEDDNGAYYLPNRVIFSTPENLPISTLNEDDFTDIESFYDRVNRQQYMGYAFSLDAKVIEEYMIVVAY